MGVIEQGTLHIGDCLELIQPGDAGTAAPLRCRCRGVDLPRVASRDPALEPLVAVWVGYRIDPDAIQAGAKLRAVAETRAETRAYRRRQRKADKLARAFA